MEEGTVTVTETAEVQAAVVETGKHKPGHGEEPNNEVIKTVLSSSTHRKETVADSEDVKFEPEPPGHAVSKVESGLDKITVVEANGRNPRYREMQTNASGDKGTREMRAEPKTGHGVTQSVEDTVTITESDTTEALCDDVCLGCVVMVSVIVNILMYSYSVLQALQCTIP